MDLFESLRNDAEILHRLLVDKGANPFDPESLALSAIDHLQVQLAWLEPDDPALKGAKALYDEQLALLCCANESDPIQRALILAHEIGHVKLHSATQSVCSTSDIDPARTSEAAPVGLERVEDYGARERRELQANVYGRELLFPRSFARKLHETDGLAASDIATRLRLPIDLIRQQILDALLLPEFVLPVATNKGSVAKPDPSQDLAAAHRGSAFLLQAGPGTGKTRTLVKRIAGLLADGVEPASILVLTFSNRAAGELAERIGQFASDAASQMWIGTFHAFGLDIVRRYHSVLGLPSNPVLFDRSDAIEVLEEILPTLPLVHYRNLWDPAFVLKDMVSAISRAKDELVGLDTYRELAESMRKVANTQDEVETAEKACEVAHVYELYERALSDNRAMDFGDLIMRPTQMLEQNATIRAQLQLRHRHVLVDEYQDVNRASTQLLRALAGEGQRLWVVGDARQSIYRFRGASSANLARFLTEYPRAETRALDQNYRSTRQILDLVEGFADGMDASKGLLPLKMNAIESDGHRPSIFRYEKPENEISGIAANIKALETGGTAFKSQAVLCRTNSKLNDIAAGLEARGIPVLHLGSLFERPEIRDCLALLSLVIDPYGAGLARVATLSRYQMSLDDVRIATQTLRTRPGQFLQKLSDIADYPGLSKEGAASLKRLAEDLVGINPSINAWEFLTTWLLDRTRHVVELSSARDVAGRMQSVALWQFLNFTRAPGPPIAGIPIRRTLDRVRQLVLLAEERDLRQVPASALQMDAVRLMTIHGSKGLEFEAVHLPSLVTTGLPSTARTPRCPPPTGMIRGPEGNDTLKDIHAREEECLFFVAASRARSALSLTLHSKLSNGSNRSESSYLNRVSAYADRVNRSNEIGLPNGPEDEEPIVVHWPSGWAATDADIGSYKTCPRRFFYTRVVRLGTARKPTAFSRTHDCLHGVIEWLAATRPQASTTDAEALAEFNRIWIERGPRDHAYADDYYQLAVKLVQSLVKLGAGRIFSKSEPIALDLPNGRVLVTPDEIATLPDGAIVVRRVRTGRARQEEYDRIEYTLYVLAGQKQFGTACRFEAVHLTDGVTEPISITSRKLDGRRLIANDLVANLKAGHFPPDPDPIVCPRCPHFFICDATPCGPISPATLSMDTDIEE